MMTYNSENKSHERKREITRKYNESREKNKITNRFTNSYERNKFSRTEPSRECVDPKNHEKNSNIIYSSL